VLLTFVRYDNAYALTQIEEGHHRLLTRKPATDADHQGISRKNKTLPRIITLGGDHTITLPLLRSVARAYGPMTVIHFDSHLYVRPSLIMMKSAFVIANMRSLSFLPADDH